MTERTIKELSVYRETAEVVNGLGQIIKEQEWWCVDYTVGRPGWVDVGYCPTFTNEAAAWAHVEKLAERVLIPAEVLASAKAAAGV
jgi:hypothetical protein